MRRRRKVTEGGLKTSNASSTKDTEKNMWAAEQLDEQGRPWRATTVIGAVVALMLVGGAIPAAAEETPSNEELFELFKQQQEQLAATADAVDRATNATDTSDDPSVRTITGQRTYMQRTNIGAYGELHFNFLEGSSGAENKSEADFHRFVLFVNHEFSDKIRVFTELELEHSLAGDGKPGEIELEQAYLQFDLPQNHTAVAGLFLIPVGIINETHEPTTFYGVERNPVEKNIVPTTWWEGGAMLTRRFDNGITTDLAVTTGLQTGRGTPNDFNLRSGRQKVAKANASDVAVTGRVVYRGIPGLEVGTTLHWSEDVNSSGENTPATLFEGHVMYQKGPFGLRALYARWDLYSDAAKDIGRDEQYGFYLEPSYKLSDQLGVFARYNQFNNAAGTSGGTKRQYDVGFNYWPHQRVVLKLDGQFQRNDNGTPELDGVNLGLGFNF